MFSQRNTQCNAGAGYNKENVKWTSKYGSGRDCWLQQDGVDSDIRVTELYCSMNEKDCDFMATMSAASLLVI